MVRSQFASGRSSVNPLTLTSESGGTITSAKEGTYFFWVQARNDIGYNLPSLSSSISVLAGQQIRITLPAALFASGEGWNSFYISASTIDASNTSTLLAVVPVPNGADDLPIDILLSTDEHLELNKSVSDNLAFPSNADLINGMLRRLDTTSRIYRYISSSTLIANDTSIFDAVPSGKWVEFSDGFNPAGINSTTDPTGCDQDISTSIDNSRIETIGYAVDGSVGPISSFWIVNDGSDVISKGNRVGVSVLVNNVNSSSYFDGFLKLVFRGYTDISTGVLDILGEASIEPMPNIGTTISYESGKSLLTLPKDLPVNSAYSIDIYPQFSSVQLPENNVIPYRAVISVYPYIFSSNSLYTESGQVIGDVIYSTEDKRRIVPDDLLVAKALSGSGMISSYSFSSVGESLVPGLIPDTASQNVLIDGNGTVYAADTPSDLEAIRAVIWTTAINNTVISPDSTVFTGSNSPSFDITINHPVINSEPDYAFIRSNYPDVIAGEKGFFNPTGIRVYITNTDTSEIRYFDTGVIRDNTQDITLNWSSGTVIVNIPNPDNNFGFYQPNQISNVTATSGSVNYIFNYAYTYSGNAISRISHSTSFGAIYELNDTLAAQLEGLIFRASLANIAILKTTNPTDGEVRLIQSDSSGNYRFFVYNSASTAQANDIDVIKPNSVLAANPGRYIAIGSNTTTTSTSTPGIETVERIDDLTSSYTFDVNSATYLYVGGTTNQDIIMDIAPVLGRRRLIRNITPDTAVYSIKESSGGSTILSLSNSSNDSIQVEGIYDGVEWQYTGLR